MLTPGIEHEYGAAYGECTEYTFTYYMSRAHYSMNMIELG